MPRFLEQRLKREYPNNPHAVYGTLNAIGAMRGNQETAKGRAMEAKHQRDMHPAMRQQAADVKEAHAHLSKQIPSFNKLPMAHRMAAHQEFIRVKRGNGY